MKIDISRLSRQAGDVLKLDIEKNSGIDLADYGSYHFPEALGFRGQLSAETDGIIRLQGEITVRYEAVCDRCVREVSEILEVAVDEEIYPPGYKPDYHGLYPEDEVTETEGDAQDPEELYFHDKRDLDLGEILKDLTLLALPIGVYCEANCPGLCPYCGRRKDDSDCHCIEPVSQNSAFDKLKELL